MSQPQLPCTKKQCHTPHPQVTLDRDLGQHIFSNLLPFPSQSCSLRWAKGGGQKQPQAEPSGESQNSTSRSGNPGQCWCQQLFLHQPLARGSLAPTSSQGSDNRWLMEQLLLKGGLLLPVSLHVHAKTHKNQPGLALFHQQTLFQIF